MAGNTRWRARVARARSLTDALDFLRSQDPNGQLVLPSGGELNNRPTLDGVTHDSAQVVPGDLFAGLPGGRRHGFDYAAAAAAAGAVALLSDRPSAVLPTLVTARPRLLLGPLSAWRHGKPSNDLDVHGVTGTNGKTSRATSLTSASRALARNSCRCVGTAADLVVVTDESAYADDPAVLRDSVAAGARGAWRAEVVIEPDRAKALAAAVAAADAGDVVLVAGRGADQVQVASGRRQAFDDRVALRRALVERAAWTGELNAVGRPSRCVVRAWLSQSSTRF